ncbi:AMP-binding protein [Aquisalimonas sp.]|uniref:AMP-binding protein n=1 Tax=Aquisalimonas sp. TaxID=1872621 RepID=UPI0025BE3BB4|nr:AMP-binding protein [Aquisalimonas sp.]
MSGGRAVFTGEVRIVDADDRELPRESVGEIVARGPVVMQGYWNLPELREEPLPLSPVGKVLKNELRAAARLQREG